MGEIDRALVKAIRPGDHFHDEIWIRRMQDVMSLAEAANNVPCPCRPGITCMRCETVKLRLLSMALCAGRVACIRVARGRSLLCRWCGSYLRDRHRHCTYAYQHQHRDPAPSTLRLATVHSCFVQDIVPRPASDVVSEIINNGILKFYLCDRSGIPTGVVRQIACGVAGSGKRHR